MPPVSKNPGSKTASTTAPTTVVAAPLTVLGTTAPQAPAVATMPTPKKVVLEVPMLRMVLPGGQLPYARARVDVELGRSPEEARALRDLADGLVAAGVLPEPNAMLAVRWLLRRLADGMKA